VRSLKSFFGFSAADGGARVVIIDAADDMTGSAANALLKMLEEPPKNAFLFLISHQPAALLPTLRSRCRELRLSALSQDMVQQALTQAKIYLSEEQSPLITRLSAGSAGQAIRLAQLDGDALFNALISTLHTLPNLNQSAALKLAESFGGQANSERFDLLIDLIEYILGQTAKTSLIPLDPDAYPTALDQKLFTKLHKGPIGARKWALVQQDISQRMRHGKAVNLDPVTLILDMLFKIEKCAAAL
jgi:DNA polymerase-3 subunit delta'